MNGLCIDTSVIHTVLKFENKNAHYKISPYLEWSRIAPVLHIIVYFFKTVALNLMKVSHNKVSCIRS